MPGGPEEGFLGFVCVETRQDCRVYVETDGTTGLDPGSQCTSP